MSRPLTSAQRSRLHRARQRHGLTVLPVVVSLHSLVEALLDAGLISLDRCEDQAAVADAAADLLDDFAQSETRRARRLAARGIFGA